MKLYTPNTLVFLYPTEETKGRIKDFFASIPNTIKPEELHCSILIDYLHIPIDIPKYEDREYKIDPKTYYYMKKQNKDTGKTSLLLCFNCFELKKLHYRILSDCPELEHSHKSFLGHIKVSSSIPSNADISKLSVPSFPIVLSYLKWRTVKMLDEEIDAELTKSLRNLDNAHFQN